MNKTTDVIIIGSGIVGSSTAYYLAKEGLKVTVLEQANNVGDGASSRNGAGVRLSNRVKPESDLADLAIYKIWPTLSEELEADLEYEVPGGLSFATNEAQLKEIERNIKMCRAANVEVKLLDGYEVRQLCPHVSEVVTNAMFCPMDGYANPMKTTLAYYRKNRKLGVCYITGQNVVALKKQKGTIRSVITEDGSVYETDKVVLAAGFNSGRIARTVGIWIPFLQRIDECIITEALEPMFKYRISTVEGHLYGHQTRHGSFLFGGNTDLERYELCYDGNARNTNKACPDKARIAVKYIPALKGVKIIRQWAGWLDSTVDGLPVMQEIPEVPGLILACGFSGHGFAIGPASGKCVSSLVMDKEPPVDISKLNYDRFKPHGA